MLRAILISCLVAACSAQMVLDCHGRGSDARINFMRLNPHPIHVPGKVKLSLDAEITKRLDEFDVQVSVQRKAPGTHIWMQVPCYFGIIGSCLYTDFCSTLQYFYRDGCPAHWADFGIEQCTCPLKPGRFTMREVEIDIPQPSDSELWRKTPGDYKVNVEIIERTSKRLILACSEIDLTLRHA